MMDVGNINIMDIIGVAKVSERKNLWIKTIK